ncbi:MAG: hypothetical protein K8R60_07920 [Burkholderiales bacterium]|nr:hypothetical protein [Burkholderiales bacterium]
MHLLVPFASDDSEACRHVLRDLALPNLSRLLARLEPTARDDAPASTFSPPHERALAAARGWRGGDGALPWAAQAALADGVAVGERAWALVTPAHWLLGRDHATMLDPVALELDEAESRALFAAIRELFESEGFATAWGAPDRWYVGHDELEGFATASLDRVIGRNVDRWLGETRSAVGRRVRRLQSEAQLVFHAHPVNEAREARDAPVVNSFWLSGCGRAQPFSAGLEPSVDASLRQPLLAADWAAWAEAWQRLDAGAIAAAGRSEDATLTLCGERGAARFEAGSPGLLQRLRRRWNAAEAHTVLEGL